MCVLIWYSLLLKNGVATYSVFSVTS